VVLAPEVVPVETPVELPPPEPVPVAVEVEVVVPPAVEKTPSSPPPHAVSPAPPTAATTSNRKPSSMVSSRSRPHANRSVMWLLERKSPDGAAPVSARDREVSTGDGGEAVRCAACRHEVTRVSARIDVDGQHEHTRMNPAGFVYRIVCYRAAPGCALRGEPSTEWSWFPGSAWQIAACAACQAHLGWGFGGEAGSFFGLIAERIVTDGGDRPS